MAYVDLNPVRAKMAERLSECQDASIGERLQVNRAKALDEFLAPLASGLDGEEVSEGGATSDTPDGSASNPEVTPAHAGRPKPPPRIRITLRAYVELLEGILAAESAAGGNASNAPNPVARWLARVASMRKRQRAHGAEGVLERWMDQRGMRRWEASLPA